jgi:type I restriction enzyme R subunit
MDEPIAFLPFRRHHPFSIYQSNRIPHWRQEGCTYFVTFRLADSLPSEVLSRLEEQRITWLHERGKAVEQLTEPEKLEYLRHYSRGLEASLDEGRGQCILRDPLKRAKVRSALEHFDGVTMRLGDFVIMPNHVHVLITPNDGENLESLLKSIKGFSARQINEAMGRTGQVWQRDNYDHLVRDSDQLGRFRRYISNNPLKSHLKDDLFTIRPAIYWS